MRTTELAIVYVLVGLGAALVLVAMEKEKRRYLDAAILIPFWPLYGPFLLLGNEALAAAAHPLATLLPDVGRLTERLQTARGRIAEIDQLLERPEFSEADTARRQQSLEESGDLRAAQTVQARLTNIRRINALRQRYQREITEVDELLTQLSVQSEVVRLAGNRSDLDDLVQEIVHRVEGLDAILEEDFPVAVEGHQR